MESNLPRLYQERQNPNWRRGFWALFLGGFGIHRFYLGYVGLGIAQIIVTLVTFGFGAIWGFIEGILILTGSMDKDAQGRPLKE